MNDFERSSVDGFCTVLHQLVYSVYQRFRFNFGNWSKMIIFGSFLTTFEVSDIFRNSNKMCSCFKSHLRVRIHTLYPWYTRYCCFLFFPRKSWPNVGANVYSQKKMQHRRLFSSLDECCSLLFFWSEYCWYIMNYS